MKPLDNIKMAITSSLVYCVSRKLHLCPIDGLGLQQVQVAQFRCLVPIRPILVGLAPLKTENVFSQVSVSQNLPEQELHHADENALLVILYRF
jgi:hypothetical protein